MIFLMITFCVLTFGIFLIPISFCCFACCYKLDAFEENVRTLSEEVAAICKAYKYLN